MASGGARSASAGSKDKTDMEQGGDEDRGGEETSSQLEDGEDDRDEPAESAGLGGTSAAEAIGQMEVEGCAGW